ncbi:MAG: cytochrome c-type biogenesis CcmF C-terminal domain-containing protein [Deltaproteobacteria bacterium]|nr:cytochrome c-type biogenesis CcmF C-terminal domain-containing protein [Deltaproteobacteria bacterium]
MANFGEILVCLTAVISAAGGAFVLGGRPGGRAMTAGRALLFSAAAFVTAALLVVVFLLVTHDYRVAYVREYADRSMGLVYLMTALWGGQEGSLLVWAAIQCWVTAGVVAWTHGKENRLAPVAIAFLAAVQVFFLLLVLGHSNPFEPLGTVATHGLGLNPLLRNPYMVIHPPTLYIGFVGFSVPVAFAIAALAEGDLNRAWITELRPWILFAWVFLGAGNLLGMVWAYEVLGWGGYWGWDPVENSSFMPWLVATALVHSAMGEERLGMFRVWNVALIVLVFDLVIFGTFLTRSNVVASVHAFSGSTTGPYLLGLIAAVTALAAGLSVWRRKLLTGSRPVEHTLSREGMLSIAIWIFVLCAAFVWLATMSPVYTSVAAGEKATVTPEFYNRWMVPLGLAVLLLVGLCTVLGWRKQTERWFVRRALWPLIAGIVAAGIAAAAGARREGAGPFMSLAPVLSFGLLGLVGASVLAEIARLLVPAARRGEASSGWRRRLGGQLVHLSVVLLFLGFTGNAFEKEVSRSMGPGDSMQVAGYRLSFVGLRQDAGYEREGIFADLRVEAQGRPLGVYSPARFVYHTHPGQPTSEVVIHTTLLADLFLILGEPDLMRDRAVVRAVVNPLTVWVWIGGALLILAGVIAMPSVAGTPGRCRTTTVLIVLAAIAAVALAAALGGPVTAVSLACGECLLAAVFWFGGAVRVLGSPEVKP